MTFDFPSGTLSFGRPSQARAIIAGDWAPIRAFAPIIETDPRAVYGDLLPVLTQADFTLVNLEAPLSDQGRPVTKSGAVFKGASSHVQGLTQAAVSAVTLANNHVFDFGVRAFEETRTLLEANGIGHTGAGLNAAQAWTPLRTKINGIRLGVVNFSEGEDLTQAGEGPGVAGWDIHEVKQRISSLKQETDLVIAVAHCGLEYIPFAPPYVMDAMKAAAEAGADLVIGHHPHVPQGICFHQGTPICCSLGNFVFYQPTPFFWRKLGYLVEIGMDPKGITDLAILPYQIHDQGVSLLAGAAREDFFRRFRQISAPLETPQGIQEAWHGFLDFYGTSGFRAEVAMIMEKMDQEPEKGAAMFRNRLTCPQHFHHWKDLVHRLVTREAGTSPLWARDLAQEWLTRETAAKEVVND